VKYVSTFENDDISVTAYGLVARLSAGDPWLSVLTSQ